MLACDDEKESQKNNERLQLNSIHIGPYALRLDDNSKNAAAPVDKPIVISFNSPIDHSSVSSSVILKNNDTQEIIELTYSYLDNDKTLSLLPVEPLLNNTEYAIEILNTLKGTDGQIFPGFGISFTTITATLSVIAFTINNEDVLTDNKITDVPVNGANIAITFSTAVDPESVSAASIKILDDGGISVSADISLSADGKVLTLITNQKLTSLARYQLLVSSSVIGLEGETMATFQKNFYTAEDPEPKFPVISDEQLLTLVQEQTFKYFYDFAHPASGMARERNTSGDLVTTGGSGFGIMALIVGIERGFITREEGLSHFEKILTFLENADRFHGAWSHWVNGNTGNVIPFSTNDNGGDLVETSFLVQGLITFRQYLDEGNAGEQDLIDRVNVLWQGVEWDWYTREEDVLYWHWSPDKEWAMNHQIQGYNEALITYVLAASSPTHTIQPEVYTQGWARNGSIVNGKSFYDITLPVGFDYGGPLFFAHYSFLGLDPRNLSDQYANYSTQNVNHSLINHQHAVENPRNYVGYTDENWGFTASDNHKGYSAHSPTNDLGVISPTAALSSFPYTPEESMKAMKFFYYQLGDRLWGPYGFYDAFNITEGWFADSYLAIDQGPIVVMIENHRTGLLWELFMSAPEVQDGLTKLGFTY